MNENKIKSPIPVIDLFAGPGGLGEGFAAFTNEKTKKIFRIALSIEKDEYAHQTLELRSFLRQFDKNKIPQQYYEHLRGNISRAELYNRFGLKSDKARKEAWKAELGLTPVKEIDDRIREALDGEKTWVLIGGPPCQAYSVIGRVRQQWQNGLDENDPRVFLYREYYRILAMHSPPVFIMENVKGLLSSKISDKNIFEVILNDLKNPTLAYQKLHGKSNLLSDCPGYYLFSLVIKPKGYSLGGDPDFEPEDFIIKAENFGIPQKRHRIIILGIRKDFFLNEPDVLINKELIAIEKVINRLPPLRSGISKGEDNKANWEYLIKNFSSHVVFKNLNEESKNCLLNIIKNIRAPKYDRGNEFLEYTIGLDYLEEQQWFLDKKIEGICNHTTRSHLPEDLYRYLFAACFAKLNKKSPKLEDFPDKLLPKHRNVKGGDFTDRFRVQIYGEPSRTITSHISKDGHYYIHPDPSQCRSLTVREAARIQTFPDNYLFSGPRTSQYQQVGNAVPPLLARQIANTIYNLFIRY
jgi:DNA (cytosine-5)-methyltransferase 1